MKLTPIEYEQFCLSLLKLEGWTARPTPVTGDQGADIVCDFAETRAVIQCKKYSQPVGNKAVQEVIAARVYYEANLAVVVSNAPYTTSAKVLAKKAMVELMHDSQLREWAKKCRHASQTSCFSHACSKDEIISALNLRGYRVTKRGHGGFAISTPAGIRYMNSEGALLAYADQLLQGK